ncbi:MAG: phosphate ABC transporter permease PstA [Acidobacteria bacterium]|nr:phosphate ABC transporter permease PstA [Acidobacteriota bacterium]
MTVFVRHSLDRSLRWLTALAALAILAMLALMMGHIAYHGWEKVTWEFVTAAPQHGMTAGGIFPAIFGTAALVMIMTVFVAPFGVLAAIYFSEYADRDSWFYKVSRQAVNNLAGVPSIVFGLFGLGFFVQFVGKGIDRSLYGGELQYGQPAILWAALTLAVLTLPVVIVSVEEALQAVPTSYREASYALGSTKSQAVFRVVLPHALPGVLTGAILAVSRAAGEVAPILFVGAAYYLPHLPTKLNDQFMELGYHIFILSTQSPDVDATKPLLYATVFVLLALTFFLNALAIIIRARMRLVQRSV